VSPSRIISLGRVLANQQIPVPEPGEVANSRLTHAVGTTIGLTPSDNVVTNTQFYPVENHFATLVFTKHGIGLLGLHQNQTT